METSIDIDSHPTEFEEQCALVEWLEIKEVMFTSIPNSTWTSSWKQKVKNTKSGLRKGLPDMVIYVPTHKSKNKKPRIIFIEMKRKKGSATSPEQKKWMEAFWSVGIDAAICFGFDDAEKYLSQFLL